MPNQTDPNYSLIEYLFWFFQYYTDPVNGYIFRSLKDIDRYLLSGKLGKHVTKNKPKGLDDSDDTVNFNLIQHNVSVQCTLISTN